jgi:hypothetical protein
MKTKITYILSGLAGLILGYYVGIQYGLSGWRFFWELYVGLVIGYSIGFSISKKEYGVLFGGMLGFLAIYMVNLIAGSEFDAPIELDYVTISMFVGWYFRPIWKPVFVSGIFTGIIGTVLGLRNSYYFGTVCLPPGVLNGSLSFIKYFIIGMVCGSLFVKFGGLLFVGRVIQKMRRAL